LYPCSIDLLVDIDKPCGGGVNAVANIREEEMMMDLIFLDNVHTIIIISKILRFMIFICEEEICMSCVGGKAIELQ